MPKTDQTRPDLSSFYGRNSQISLQTRERLEYKSGKHRPFRSQILGLIMRALATSNDPRHP